MNEAQNILSSELVTKAKNYALKCHTETNHKYDGKPYETHLQMVVDYACKYAYLIGDNVLEAVIASAWTHDTIEDCRQTYNDVKTELGVQVAEITYALTNEKGRSRKQIRSNYISYSTQKWNLPCMVRRFRNCRIYRSIESCVSLIGGNDYTYMQCYPQLNYCCE